MKRKDFLQMTSMGLGALLLPGFSALGNMVDEKQFLKAGLDTITKKQLADVALNTAKKKGASFADVRIGRYLTQAIQTRENRVLGVSNNQSYGVGVRVIANGTWGFAATNKVTADAIAKCAEQAVLIAKANSKLQQQPVQLAPQKGLGEVSWKTPIKKNAFEVPVSEKTDLLLKVNAGALAAGASFVNSGLAFVNEQKYYANSEGSYIEQDIHRLNPTFTVTVVNKQTGKFKTRDQLCAPMGMGYEYLEGAASEKLAAPNGITLYRYSYDMAEDAVQAANHAKEKHNAKSVAPGQYDLVLDPSHLGLTIHESVGHPLKLDRVLGYEANYAGTSFATLDKWKSKNFKYGSPIVNIVADRKQPHFLNTIGFDDDGVPAKQWDQIRNGILVNYQATRDQAHVIGEKESFLFKRSEV